MLIEVALLVGSDAENSYIFLYYRWQCGFRKLQAYI